MKTKENKIPEGPLVIERTLNAPLSRVWKAITDKEEMKRWYFDLKEFKPQKGFEFQFDIPHNNTLFCHRCKVTEVIVEKKIVYSWRYEGHEGNSLVTFELFNEGGKTRVKLTHEGLETFPRTADFEKKNFVAGWTSIIGEGLKRFVET
jgi:uncharacterized protein YndB with AHSA1/START domain